MLTALQDTSLQSCLALGIDLPVDYSHRFSLVQEHLGYLDIYNIYESRAFLRIYGEYSISYTHFSLNLSPSLPLSLLTLLPFYGLLLGRLYVQYVSPEPFVYRFNTR